MTICRAYRSAAPPTTARPRRRRLRRSWHRRSLGGLATPVMILMVASDGRRVLVDGTVLVLGRAVERVEAQRRAPVVDDVVARVGGDDRREVALGDARLAV